MLPGSHSSKNAFDINILDAQALDTQDGLATALRTIEAVCHRGESEIAEMVSELDSRPYILEYIISGALRFPVGPCALLTLIVLPSSAREGGTQETLKVDNRGVPHIRNIGRDG